MGCWHHGRSIDQVIGWRAHPTRALKFPRRLVMERVIDASAELSNTSATGRDISLLSAVASRRPCGLLAGDSAKTMRIDGRSKLIRMHSAAFSEASGYFDIR
jgi:hypothetical protein